MGGSVWVCFSPSFEQCVQRWGLLFGKSEGASIRGHHSGGRGLAHLEVQRVEVSTASHPHDTVLDNILTPQHTCWQPVDHNAAARPPGRPAPLARGRWRGPEMFWGGGWTDWVTVACGGMRPTDRSANLSCWFRQQKSSPPPRTRS